MNRTTRSTNSSQERVLLALAGLLIALLASTPAHAQLDPLISLKRVPPRIVIVFDTSFEMLYDANPGGGTEYCDPVVYTRTGDPQMATALGVPSGQATYRRHFRGLKIEADGSYSATGVSAYDDSASPCGQSRLEVARAGVALALRRSGNPRLHFGLVRLRQTMPVWRPAPLTTCTAVKVVDPTTGNPIYAQSDSAPCAVGAGYVAFNPATNGGANAAAPAPVPATPLQWQSAANKAVSLLTDFEKPLLQSPLIATGRSTATVEDRPLALTLDDARSEVVRAMGLDGTLAAYRNTVVVLIAGGKDFTGDPVGKAATFLNVTAGGVTKRVPIFVVGVTPKDDHEEQLRRIATASGGLYSKAFTKEGVERVINLALQAGCQRAGEFNDGLSSEYPLVSPVVGTVNLEKARSATGEELPGTVITTPSGSAIPQRNNLLLTASFALGRASLAPYSEGFNPGFEGRLRAFRAFKPVPDSTKPSGYNFTKDGTPLWPDVDGRPWLAGVARVPTTPAMRNIYTYVPGQGVISFHTDNLSLIVPSLALPADKSGWGYWLIDMVRRQPLGSIISSTPAVMDAPSLDPPPDEDYGRNDATGTYAYNHRHRRSIIFVGANDGMIHAIDARTGIEMWAFIPYNLLPKLQTLFSGQSPYEFSYFVDHSPKIAEIKMSGEWRSILMVGEGWGGTFYQAFDVTDAGDGGPLPDSDDWDTLLQTFRDPEHIRFMWSFPQYEHFNPSLVAARIPAADTTSFGRVKFFGDLSSAATVAERKMGFTWSDPAVGALDTARSVNAAIVGSGYFPAEAEIASSPNALPNRVGAGVGRTFYLINMATGQLVGNSSGSCGTGTTGTGCLDVGQANNGPKNALQADPTVTSDYGSYVAKKAYMGDLQGNYYRFDFNFSGSITKTVLKSTSQPIYASSALMWVGSTQQYIFFATGSDMLPSSPSSTFGTGTFSMYGLKDSGGAVTDAFTKIDMAAVTNATPENPVVTDVNKAAVGIPVGERPSTSPSVAGEIVFFTTTIEGGVPVAGTAAGMASAEPRYNMYAVTYGGSNGYPPVGSTGTTSTKNNPKTGGGTAVAPVKTGTGRATAPFVVDQHLYFATSSGSGANVEAFGDPNDYNNGVGQVGVRVLSWREIRR